MQSIIDIKQADIGYGKEAKQKQILRGIHCAFNQGEFIGLVGLNGSGKSSLLKSMSGLNPLLSGEVHIEGESIENMDEEQLAKKLSLVLTEKFGGFNLCVLDVVESGLMPHTDTFHRLRAEDHVVVDTAIAQCGLQTYRNSPVEELSDGYFQRMVIAKALAQQTPVMLLDEPAAFLDYAGKHDLMQMLRQLCDTQNKCVILSSHDLDILLKYCDKLMILHNREAFLLSCAEAKTHHVFKEISGGYL